MILQEILSVCSNHRRTRRDGLAPSMKNFKANSVFRATCSKILNIKSVSNAVKNSRASASCSKTWTVKKFSIPCIQWIFTWGWFV